MKLLGGSFTSSTSGGGASGGDVARNVAMSIAKAGLPVSFLVVKEDSLGRAARATGDYESEDSRSGSRRETGESSSGVLGAIKVAVEVHHTPTCFPVTDHSCNTPNVTH